MSNSALVWLRNDLRLHDHEALHLGAQSDRLTVVYVFDPRHFAPTRYGFEKTGGFRAQFVLECLADLRESLKAKGNDLVVRHGLPHDILPQIAEQVGADAFFVHDEPMSEEHAALESVLESLPEPIEVQVPWGHTLFHLDDLGMPVDRLPEVFTAFRKKVEKRIEVRPPFPTPTALPPMPDGVDPGEIPSLADLGVELLAVDPRRAMETHGGETRALARLDTYFWQGKHIETYKETRNGLLGADYSSKFSPWLAHGCLSPRHVYAEVERYQTDRVSNDSTCWMIFELLWRDYFRFWGLKHDDLLFHAGGPKRVEVAEWGATDLAFDLWTQGQTGIPFVDANMRELRLTGWMSNRGRQNVASFWTKILGGDWRQGAAWFERLLIDYDVTSNWGNWAYVGGVGNDPRDRYFNVITQAERYDPEAAFVKHWCPELSDLPAGLAHQPWKITDAEQQMYGFTPGTDYPKPIVDLEEAYAELRSKSDRNEQAGRAKRGTKRR